MSINITVARTVPRDAFARIESLAQILRTTDANFMEVPIEVTRGELTDGVSVVDHEDDLRGQLLRHLLDEALKEGSDSILGELR